MALPRSLLQHICSLLLFVAFSNALKFDLQGVNKNTKPARCIRNFVAKDTLVVVTATVGVTKGDGMSVNMQVCSQLSLSLGLPSTGAHWANMDRSWMP